MIAPKIIIERDPLLICLQEIESITLALYEIPLDKITQHSVRVYEEQVRAINYELFNIIKVKRDKGIREAKKYTEDAITHLYVALQLFDDKQEKNTAQRLKTRFEELIHCRNNLQKAIEYIEPMVKLGE